MVGGAAVSLADDLQALGHMRTQGLKLAVRGSELRVLPAEAVDANRLGFLRDKKAGLLRALGYEETLDDRVYQYERAAASVAAYLDSARERRAEGAYWDAQPLLEEAGVGRREMARLAVGVADLVAQSDGWVVVASGRTGRQLRLDPMGVSVAPLQVAALGLSPAFVHASLAREACRLGSDELEVVLRALGERGVLELDRPGGARLTRWFRLK